MSESPSSEAVEASSERDRALIFALGAFYPELDACCSQAAQLAQQRGARSVSELRDCTLLAFGELDYGVTSQPADAREGCARTLAQAWGIETRADLVGMVEGLLAGMHQAQFASEALVEIADEDEVEPARALALQYADELGPSGILAWDLARAVHVTRLAVGAQLLTEAEGWSLLSSLPLIARAAFSSWSDYAASYLAGFAYWRLGTGPLEDDDDELMDLQENAARLLEHPLSIWQFVALQ